MADRTVLIIGGTGFIGSTLTAALARHGLNVSVLTRRPPLRPVAGVAYHIGDQSDAELLRPLLASSSVIIHSACATTPGSSARDPRTEAQSNILPITSLLHAMQEVPTPAHLILLSSGGTVYGNPVTLQVAEEEPLHPLSYHGAGKVAAELFVETFAFQFGWTATILRPSNIYGPGQPRRPEFGIIPAMLEHARSGHPISIWGDGSVVRDFLYIDDLVSACHMALEQRADGTFNVGSGKGTSILDLGELVQSVTRREFGLQFRPARRVDVQSVVLDISKLGNRTGWCPTVGLEEGIRRTWEWLCQLQTSR